MARLASMESPVVLVGRMEATQLVLRLSGPLTAQPSKRMQIATRSMGAAKCAKPSPPTCNRSTSTIRLQSMNSKHSSTTKNGQTLAVLTHSDRTCRKSRRARPYQVVLLYCREMDTTRQEQQIVQWPTQRQEIKATVWVALRPVTASKLRPSSTRTRTKSWWFSISKTGAVVRRRSKILSCRSHRADRTPHRIVESEVVVKLYR